jgi:hypothetical protein
MAAPGKPSPHPLSPPGLGQLCQPEAPGVGRKAWGFRLGSTGLLPQKACEAQALGSPRALQRKYRLSCSMSEAGVLTALELV